MHAPPRKKEALPRPVKITKKSGTQRGKVDFNPLKFGRQLQGRQLQLCPINICLTHKSVDLRTFWPRPVPRGLKAPPRASLIRTIISSGDWAVWGTYMICPLKKTRSRDSWINCNIFLQSTMSESKS